jgi:mono/diheme cytochrome c family protein
MINSRLARSTAALLGLAAIAACSKGSSSTNTAPAPATSQANAAPAAAARPFTAAQVAMGDSIYHARGCRNCHGMDAKGAANGPNLTTGKFMHVDGSYQGFVDLITTGVPADKIKDPAHKVAMSPRGGARPAPLTDDQIKAVAAYVYSLNHP